MTSGGDGADLEVIPIDGDAPGQGPDRAGRNTHRVGVTVAAVTIVALAVLVTALSLNRPGRRSGPSPGPTSEEINARPSVQRSELVTVLGDKIISRGITAVNGTGPLGLIRLAPDEPPAGVVLAVAVNTVLAQGSDLSGFEQTGTWAYSATGPRRRVYLGASTGFVLSVDSRAAWLTTGSTVREVGLSSGSTLVGPYSLDGRLIAAAGVGLVLQRGGRVVWWLPGSPGRSETVGSGQALGALGDYILWQTTKGLLTITDPNIGRTVAVAFAMRPSQPLSAVAMSSDHFRVAAATNTAVVISDTIKHHRVTVRLGPITELAWIDDNTLLARVGGQGVSVVDASSGAVVHEPGLGYNGQGLGVFEPPTP